MSKSTINSDFTPKNITDLINYCSNKHNQEIYMPKPIKIEILTVEDDDNLLLDYYMLDGEEGDLNAFSDHILPKLKKFEHIIKSNKLTIILNNDKINSSNLQNINKLFELHINKREYDFPIDIVKDNDNIASRHKYEITYEELEDVLPTDDIPDEELYYYPPKNVKKINYIDEDINIFISPKVSHFISKICLYNCKTYNLKDELCILYNPHTGDSVYVPYYFSKAKFEDSKFKQKSDNQDSDDSGDVNENENEYEGLLKRYIIGNKAIAKNGCMVEINNDEYIRFNEIDYDYSQLVDYDFDKNTLIEYYFDLLIDIVDYINNDELSDLYEQLAQDIDQIEDSNFNNRMNALLREIKISLENKQQFEDEVYVYSYINRYTNIKNNILISGGFLKNNE